MSDHLVFMMGQFEARFPTDRKYAKNHMWAKLVDRVPQLRDAPDRAIERPPEEQREPLEKLTPVFRFGFTAYAVRLLQDVYFLDWSVDPGTVLAERQQIGSIESKKAESDLFAPIGGRLVRLNDELLSDPSAINVDKYERGWLLEIEGRGDQLLAPEQYIEHLESIWEVTQRTIKGQWNE